MLGPWGEKRKSQKHRHFAGTRRTQSILYGQIWASMVHRNSEKPKRQSWSSLQTENVDEDGDCAPRQEERFSLTAQIPKPKSSATTQFTIIINIILLFNSLLFQKLLLKKMRFFCFRHLKKTCLYEQETFQPVLRVSAFLKDG